MAYSQDDLLRKRGSGVSPFPYLVGDRGRPRVPRNTPSGLRMLWPIIAVLVFALAIGGIAIGSGFGHHHTVTTTVQSKERVCGGSKGGCKYLVFTEHGTFKITDSLFIGTTRFNSSDVYGRIHTCDKYRIEYYGWRLPYFSTYPNIVTATDLGPVAGCRPS